MKRDAIHDTLLRPLDPADTGTTSAIVPVAALLVAAACVVGAYWSTFVSIVETWARSQTFAHGFAVPPIAAWLLWRKRAEVMQATARPAWSALAVVALASLAWFAGDLAEANVLRQFAAMAVLVLAVPAIAGWAYARTLAFPLAFLFFAVPFGAFMLPPLMQLTAFFTVAALRLTGIPVYQDGLRFVIPSGSWSVVEACSGVRYLIASAMIGTLFAYLNYRTLRRRLAFVGVAIAVPIVANWVRAYLIVLLGHLSNNRLAAGVDHLIYGWIFFGVVMLLMFWIGARWREDVPALQDSNAPPAVSATSARGAATVVTLGSALAAFLLVADIAPLVQRHFVQNQGDAALELPGVAIPGGWQRSDRPMTDWRPKYTNPSGSRFDTYVRNGNAVGMYLAMYRGQSGERKLVSSDNALVTSEDKSWYVARSDHRRADVANAALEFEATELRGAGTDALRVWQWYWVDGRLTGNATLAKIYTGLARLSGHGDDSATVILVTRVGGGGEDRDGADALLGAFARDAAPSVAAALQSLQERR